MIMRVILVGIALIMGGWFGYRELPAIYHMIADTRNGEGFGAPFALVDQRGQPITEAAFRGHPTLLFFGFTHCPEVCPTTLPEMDSWLKQLGEEGKDVRAFFVTIDPERDTAAVMNTYVGNFSQRITGITGQPDKVAAMAKSYGIYFRKVPLDSGDYTMDHTASVLLLGRNGEFEGTIAYEENPKTALAKIKRLATEG